MLTAEHKEYIRRHYCTMTAYKMAKAIGKTQETVKSFMKREGLVPLKPHRDTIGFTCTPPHSCFNCPFSDCIRGVELVKQTSKEIEYHALGGIDTVGRGNEMTNRKIKNAQRNMMMNNILETNVWNILGTMVCLHRMGESKKKITAVLEEYRTETVPYWEQLAAAEVQNTMVRERLAKIHIEYSEVRSLISFITGNKLHSSVVDALTENLGILCLQINSSFGYGRKRLLQLFGQLRAYKSENGDAKSDAEKLFNAEYEDNQNVLPDIDSLRYRKPKVDLEEAKEQKRNLEALRLFQEKNCKSSDTAGIS